MPISLCVTVLGNWLSGDQHILQKPPTGHVFAPLGMTFIWLQSSCFSSAIMKDPRASTDQNTRDYCQHRTVKFPWHISSGSLCCEGEPESASLLHPLIPPPRAYPWASATVQSSSIRKPAKGLSQNSHLHLIVTRLRFPGLLSCLGEKTGITTAP